MTSNFVETYLNYFKLFRLKGDPYIIVTGNKLFGVEETFEVLWFVELQPHESLPMTKFIACKLKDFAEQTGIINDLHIYNYVMQFISRYYNSMDVYNKLDDNIGEKIYEMKSSDNMSLMRYHLEDDINRDFIISISYGLFSLAKGDIVDNYIRHKHSDKDFVLKSVIHKKKQNVDIVCFHRFLIF